MRKKVFDEAHRFFMDDQALSFPSQKGLARFHIQHTYVNGWPIGEKFDDRYDTEVGGNQILVTQSLNEKRFMKGGLPASMSLDQFSKWPKQPRPPQVVDYQEGRRYSLDEAETVPELAPVVKRLKERIKEYSEHL